MQTVLTKFNNKYSDFLTLSPVAISLSEINTGNLIFMNSFFEKLFNVKKEDAFGKSLTDLNIISKEMRTSIAKEIIENGELRRAGFEMRNSNNDVKKIHLSCKIITFDAVKYFLSYIVDLTDVAETKQQIRDLAAIVEYSEDAIFSKSLTGDVLNWNKGAEKMMGYSAKEMIGKNISKIIPTDFVQQKKSVIARILNHETIEPYETILLRKDKTNIFVSFSASPLKDEAGNIIGVSLIARDISNQKKTEEELIVLNKKLEAQGNEKEKRAIELDIANKEIIFQDNEKEKRAAELIIANKELLFQNDEKEKRAAELSIANEELLFQNNEKEKRANELSIANEELAFQNNEKEKRANELSIANEELAFQNNEKEKRASELDIANKELAFQNNEKEKRANELGIANEELAFQNNEKEKRAAELFIANKELIFQTSEKEKRAAELVIADIELDFQNKEKEKKEIVKRELEVFNYNIKLASQYSRSLIEASLDPLVTININGKITDVNQASVNVTGVLREHLIDTDFSNYFTEPTKAQAGYKQVFENGFVENYPLTIKHINGRLTDVLYNASVYKNENGKVLGVFAAARDVTKQKLIESNLDKSLKEISGYKKALDESSIVAITDKNGIINFANDNFCEISKYTREELIGQNHHIVNSGFHSKLFMKNLWETICNNKIWRGEIKNKAKDGSTYWVDSTIVPFIDEFGEIYQYVAIRADITAKKLLSQYSLSLIEASRDPLVTISTEGKITDMNEAMVKITGFTREKIKGTNFKNYFTDPQKASEVYQEVFEKGFVADYPLTIKDHKLTDVLFNGSIYKDDRGNVLGAVIVARDITEQKRIEKELIEAKVFAEKATLIAEEAQNKAEGATKIAEIAVKAKQQFLSNMSHEIRTPMNAIIGFTKVVLKTELTAKQKEYLNAIKISGDALIVLINDILDLAKVDAGKMKFEKTPFKLASSISAMLHLFEPKIQEKNLKLIKEYDPLIPDVLVGDPIRLHQIILNLVSNAVKFTTNGEITVSVKLLNEDNDIVTIEFDITDTGIGILETKLPSIFDDFQQATSGTSRIYGGTGLGLAIVKQLVEPQGGTITVKSKFGEGSTFSFTLPFQKTKAEAELESNSVELDTEIKNIKVLVVEDIALNQLLMKTLLDDFGFERDIAGNGKIAIEKLQEKLYDIVLMDLQMPEMNGFEATEYIRKKMNSKIPIIALTADVTTVDLEKCKAVGMNDYIAKPVDEKLLYSKIINLVKKRMLLKNNTPIPSPLNEQLKYTDLKYLHHRTKSNPKLMMEMIGLYLEQTPLLLSAMKKGLLDKDWQGLHAAVHKMIPSFSIVGISKEFEDMAKKIQDYAHAHELNDEIQDMMNKIENVCQIACLELHIEYLELKKIKNE
jgi:PAS domain S-box-containing protein